MVAPIGAQLADWNHFDLVLGLGADILPVIPDPDAPKSEFTNVKHFGKIPSEFDGEGGAHGIAKWAALTITPAMVNAWSKDRRYSLCVRTSAVRAIDVDIEDPLTAERVARVVNDHLSKTSASQLPLRYRDNSTKFLLAFKLEGAHKKRIITLAPGGVKAPRIEFLADGQQFVACGSHPSGALYQWQGGLPHDFPVLTLTQFEEIWTALDTAFAHVPSSSAVASTTERLSQKTLERSSDLLGDIQFSEPSTELILTEIDDAALTDLGAALAYGPLVKAATDNSVWSEVGYALLSLGARGASLFEAFSNSHAHEPGFEVNGARDWWSAHTSAEPRSDFRHIFTIARRLGWRGSSDAQDFAPVPVDPQDVAPPVRPVILLTAGQLHTYARQAEDVLSPNLYTQGGALIRIGEASELEDEIQRDANQRSIVRVTTQFIRRQLTRDANLMKFSQLKEEWVPVDCPRDLAENIAEQKAWPNLRMLDAIVRAPFIRSDGSVCDVPGYDTKSGAYYIPNATFPKLADHLGVDDALVALQTLRYPFEQFPYANGAALAAFIAHILTEAGRLAISNAPMFWYTAPNPGTGKTLLSEMASTIVHGSAPALRPWVDDAEEIRKTLFSSLLAGDRSIAFDNVPNGYKARSPALCAFLTAGPLWQDRKLGVSETISVRNRAVVSASGNNVTPVSDMARRSLVVRLDASVTAAQLRERVFEINNLRRYVLDHRVELLMAALTIVKAHQGQPCGRTALPSFEDWSRLVRDPLMWLGMADPVDTQSDETDDESASLNEAFRLLAITLNGRDFTAHDVMNSVIGFSDPGGSIATAMQSAGCNEIQSAVKIGYWLRDCRDKVAGNVKLIQTKGAAGQLKKWRFQPLGNGDLE